MTAIVGRASGWTLIEVVVSVVLVAVMLMVVVGIIPMGARALKKAENLQAATLYADEALEDAERLDFVVEPATAHLDRRFEINRISYRLERDIYAVDPDVPSRLYDVVVRVTWQPQPEPLVLRTRVYHP